MAIETNPNLGAEIVEDAKEFVLYSWSVQDAINPIAVAGGGGALLLGLRRQALPRLRVAARQREHRAPAPEDRRGDQGAGRQALHDRAADGERVALAARPAAGGGHARRPVACRSSRTRAPRRTRTRSSSRGCTRAAQDHRALSLVPRSVARRDLADRRPAALAERARDAGVVRMFDPYTYRCPAGHPDPCPVCTGAPHLEEILQYEGPQTVAAVVPRDRDRDERGHPAAGRLPAVDPRGVRPPRDPARPRRGDGGLRAHGPLVRVRELGRRPGHHHGGEGHQLGLRARSAR